MSTRINLNSIYSSTPLCIGGFDSAWSGRNKGGLCLAEVGPRGIRPLFGPEPVNFSEASNIINSNTSQMALLLMIDQPIIVPNESGSRPVESAIGSLVGRLQGGIQRASRQKDGGKWFGVKAPIWNFLESIHVNLDPVQAHRMIGGRVCIETYPCLSILGLFPEFLERGIIAKYNPSRKTFRQSDWQIICSGVAIRMADLGLHEWNKWCQEKCALTRKPSKQEQDQLDALICFLSGLVLWRHGLNAGMIVGDIKMGYIASPANPKLVKLLRMSAASKIVPIESNF